MAQSTRKDFGFTPTLFDSSVAEPTSKLLVESMSRMKAAPLATAESPLSHLFPKPAQDQSGQFQLVCEIASGGMATVHLGINRGVAGFEKFAAVKRIHPHLAQDKEFYEMFIDEARIAAQVNHPFVCSVFDFGHADQSYYIAMEFLNGEPLSKVLACAGEQFLTEARFPKIVARIVANLAEGLHAAHSLCDSDGRNMDIIHRDVTPQNLFVLYDGTVRVTDFGIARARHRLHHTHGQRLKGTLSYMAPEQLQRGTLDQGVDIWGLGVVMWEMLTARKLFNASSEGEAVMEVLSQPIVPPSTYNPRVSSALDRIVMRALERNRSHRYGSARELSRALEQYLTNSGTSLHATDVAEWLGRLFPTGDGRGRELLEMARATAEKQPRSERPREEKLPSTRREPLGGSHYVPSPPPRDAMESISALSLDAAESVIQSIQSSRTKVSTNSTRSRRRAEHIISAAFVGTLSLIGFGVLGSMHRQAPAASRPSPQVMLNSLIPSRATPAAPHALTVTKAPVVTQATVEAKAITETKPAAWSVPLPLDPSQAPRVEPQPTPPSPQKRVAARAQTVAAAVAGSTPALPDSIPAMPAFLAARDFAPKSQLGGVFIKTTQGPATIFEAGRRLGTTGQQLDLVAGRHVLSLTSGSGAHDVVVDVAAGNITVASVSIDPSRQ